MNWLSPRMNTPFHTPQIKVHQLSDGFHFVLELTFFHFTLLLEKVYQTTSQPLPHILFTKSSIKSAARSTNWIVSSLAVKKILQQIQQPFGKVLDVKKKTVETGLWSTVVLIGGVMKRKRRFTTHNEFHIAKILKSHLVIALLSSCDTSTCSVSHPIPLIGHDAFQAGPLSG